MTEWMGTGGGSSIGYQSENSTRRYEGVDTLFSSSTMMLLDMCRWCGCSNVVNYWFRYGMNEPSGAGGGCEFYRWKMLTQRKGLV